MEDKERTKLYSKSRKIHPKKRSNCLFHYLFCWEIPIVVKGWRRDLSEDDMYSPLKSTDSRCLGDKLEELWSEEEKFRKKPSLLRALIRQFGFEFLIYGLVYFPIDLAVILFQPQFLMRLLDYYAPNQNNRTYKEALLYSSAIILLALFRVLFFHWFILQLSCVGLKARIACSSLIYRKALNLKRTIFQRVTTGQILNLLSNDVYRLDTVFAYLHFIWISPLEIISAGFFLNYTLGHAALSGIGVIILFMVLQIYMSKKISDCRKEVAAKTDYRIRLMNDIVVGIQVIKMYTWEQFFVKLIQNVRNLEMKKIGQSLHFRVVNNSLRLLFTRLSIFICVLIMIFNDLPITSQYIYGLISSYEFLKVTAVIFVPLSVTLFSEARVSLLRIEKFLLIDFNKTSRLIENILHTETKPSKNIVKQKEEIQNKPLGILIDNLSVKWDSSSSHIILKNIKFKANAGETIGVVGAAGSGKSTLLHTILKEVEITDGIVDVNGTISYASQDPWVFPASIKQNILFGEEMNNEKYLKVTKVCALDRDFYLFPFGDRTLVGDRGVMLSGGQKARINLARAIYRDADIYLLDDPLSAVDAHVAEHIYKECILGYLKNKCVILVTHQVHHLKDLKKIYLLNSGYIQRAKFEDLESVKNNIENNKAASDEIKELKQHHLPLETKEHRSTDSASRKIYKSYCLASGTWFKTIGVVIIFILSQALANGIEIFVAFIVNMKQEVNFHNELKKIFTNENCSYMYSAFIIIYIAAAYGALRSLVAFCLKASKNLHNAMLVNIVNGTMEFFNHHSSGRILNRFSKDLGIVDETIPINLAITVTMMLLLVGICVNISILNHWMVIPTIILFIAIGCYGVFFQPTTKNLKRTEAITKSTVFTHTMASLQGLTTVRAFSSQKTLQTEFDNHMNLYSSAYYMLIAIYNTLTFWTDLTCVIYTAVVVFSFFFLHSKIYVAFIGLSITQAISLVGLFQYGMRTWSELDSQMTSVERVAEYAELTPENDTGTYGPPLEWPSQGKISFRSVLMQYPGSTNPVLKQISFDVNSGEKIGVVGRTGAGKSSLISAIFRLFDFNGQILIDDLDTKSIPLKVLRSKLSIIPQDPVLFLGTLRQNVDPYDEYSDLQLWQALEEVELKDLVSRWPKGLETVILEGGSNVSVGQRQLLCLMRAILKKSKIIVLDEATANVDLKTDELIQSVIRKKFQTCTVLTIAHRLNTIMDSDKILVMDAGKVAEFGTPKDLLQNKNGLFYGFVQKGGIKKDKL